MLETIAIAAGALAFGGTAFWLGRNHVARPAESPEEIITSTDLRHQHTRWKKDLDTNFYYCADCGDRYLDGKPK